MTAMTAMTATDGAQDDPAVAVGTAPATAERCWTERRGHTTAPGATPTGSR